MPAAAAAPRKQVAQRTRKPVMIETAGVGDIGGGAGRIKMLLLGEPDSGKTRFSSAFPRPLYLACEPTVGASIASRKIAYEAGWGAPHIIRINQADRPSDAMFDALDFLAEVPRKKPPGGLPKYQTAILDTADGLSRLLKEEWANRENAAMFTGRDAWGFLEAKFSLIMTRLLNLDMNVIVLCHLKDRDLEEQVGETTQKRTIYEPLLQGASKDNIYNDFDLIGLMKNELAGTTQHRGISFEPTPTFPFLKDHYALDAPGDKRLGRRFWPITMHDGTKGEGSIEEFEETNYLALWNAMVADLDDLPDSQQVEEVPEAGLPSAEGVVGPGAGGPVAGATDVPAPPPAAPAKKAAPAKAAPAKVPPKAVAPAPGAGATVAPPTTPTAPATETTETISTTATASPEPTGITVESEPSQEGAGGDPGGADGGEPAASDAGQQEAVAESAPATSGPESEPQQEAAPASADDSATSVPTEEQALATVQDQLGGEVVSVDNNADHTDEEGRCPICGKDMSKEQPDLVQLSRLKHRTLVLPDGRKFYDTGGCCYEDYQSLNQQKASNTGLYAPA